MIRPSRTRPRTREGFTIIELLLVVMIIGVLAALIGPGVIEMIADSRAQGAAEDIVRLQRHVRARVMETGLAHLVQFDPAANSGLGSITVWEGMNNHCATTPWQLAVTNGAATNHFPVEQIQMYSYNASRGGVTPTSSDADRQVIRLTAMIANSTGVYQPATAFNLCFQPNGQTFQGAYGGATWAFTVQQLTYRFDITRTVNNVQHGPLRQVIYPPGGNARHLI